MKILLLFGVVSCLFLFSEPAVAQGLLEKKEIEEIKYLARKKVGTDLIDLLNTLAFEDISEFDRKQLIENSFLPNPNQVFFDESVIIENDLDGTPAGKIKAADLNVERYLKNFDLYYQKKAEPTIHTTSLFASDIKRGKEHWYVQVFFQIIYKSQHTKGKPFEPMWRVAELRADKIEKQWVTLISRIGFFNPSSTGANTPATQDLQKKITEDSLNTKAVVEEYSLRIDELLSLGEQSIATKNDKKTAIDYYSQAKFLEQRFQLSNKRLAQLYQLYKNKGDIIWEAEIYDKALAWYEVAQALMASEEVKQKIAACKKHLKN
jgi:hypothetical protein